MYVRIRFIQLYHNLYNKFRKSIFYLIKYFQKYCVPNEFEFCSNVT